MAVGNRITNTATYLDWTPTHNDLELAILVRRALASVQDGGRFGDRKVFIGSLRIAMLCIEAEAGGTLTEGATLQYFKAWLLRSRLLTRDGTMEGSGRSFFVALISWPPWILRSSLRAKPLPTVRHFTSSSIPLSAGTSTLRAIGHRRYSSRTPRLEGWERLAHPGERCSR